MFALAFLASIVTGHDPDIWFLVAAILFAVEAVLVLLERSQPVLVPAGLALVALGLLVT